MAVSPEPRSVTGTEYSVFTKFVHFVGFPKYLGEDGYY